MAKKTYLRDRVAAVSNRTADVANGDRLQVLDHGRRFFKVQTDQGAQGWINEKMVATQDVFDQFAILTKAHEKDPIVATGVVRDDVYMHLTPGRETEHFLRLGEGEKLKLLRRATLPKPVPPGLQAIPSVVVKGKAVEATPPAPPAMDDWWLVRDSRGNAGWVYSRLIDVDAPDSLVRYSEGQRIVGAYILTRVYDPDAPQDDKNIPEYVTVTSPYVAGLPYDFNQVRVFIWNVKKHRYETAYRDKNIEGYLPLKVTMASDPYGKAPASATVAPTYSYHVLAGDAPRVVPDPATGAIVPGKTVLKTYRLEGNLVRRVLPPNTTAPDEAHPEPVQKKAKNAARVRSRRRR
ncbi:MULTISPECIES: SH3 domain-containing protein [Acidobacteriaceae]|uniref:SH3 domain-containing protein n=1 Tax=Acidobacteriaceae TaxID=204434 RepID=UPI0020B132AF|nr:MULTISPECIES: SH3 domain-containing protein [Acidobacteriaceae]MDW5264992.1 SH3 domain-containing protein [Edaphobacter sp.]